MEAHTNVDVVVDLAQLRALLQSRLPLVFAGASVESAGLPWPEVSPGEHDAAGDEVGDAEAEHAAAYDSGAEAEEGDSSSYVDHSDDDE